MGKTIHLRGPDDKLQKHLHRFPLGTPYRVVIGYLKKLQETWRTVKAIHADKTGVGNNIIEDMNKSGLKGVNGINFTDTIPVSLRPLLHIPYDPKLFAELNVERYELAKNGKIHYSHPEGTHDDRFWALALAVYGTETTTPRSKPVARIM